MSARRLTFVALAFVVLVIGAYAVTYTLWSSDSDEPQVNQTDTS